MHISRKDLKKLLLESKLVSEKAFDETAKEADRDNREVIDLLIEKEIIAEDFLVELLARYFNVPKVDLRGRSVPPDILNLIPEAYAKSNGVVVFGIGEDEQGREYAEVAMRDPDDIETISYLEAKLNRPIRVSIASPTSLNAALREYHFGLAAGLKEEIEQKLEELRATGQEENLAELASAVPVVWIIERILEQSATLDASDVHFEPFEEKFVIRFRIDGILREVLVLPISVAPIFAARVKVLTDLRVDEHLKPQDGRFTFNLEKERIDVRVSIIPVFWGEKVVMRLLRSVARPRSFAALGLSDRDREILEEEIKSSHGMILVTGPTGSGKTTTLYTALQMLNRPEVNVSTIEDPVEYTIVGVNQTQVNVQAGLTFATGLRSFLRQDPDILMIGEIRDSETAELAINAALTGHLVLSTLHTNDAPTAIPRFLDLGSPAFLLASTLNVIIAQRLVRRVCKHCVSSRPPNEAEKKAFAWQVRLLNLPDRVEMPKFLYSGAGCDACGGSGYHGRVGIYEILPASDKIRELILQKSTTTKLREVAFEEGMTTMFENGIDKAERGITSFEEVMRVVRE